MPIPNTPVAKPRRSAAYQAETNGTPHAKIEPATPRKNATTSSIAYEPTVPATATSTTGGSVAHSTPVKTARPPSRSEMIIAPMVAFDTALRS